MVWTSNKKMAINKHLQTLVEGDFVWMKGERNKYEVQCRSTNFLILTKPFNAQNTVLYSVVDLSKGLRGVDDHNGLGYETKEQCLRALLMFVDGTAQFSHRNPPIKLEIEKVQYSPKGVVVNL